MKEVAVITIYVYTGMIVESFCYDCVFNYSMYIVNRFHSSICMVCLFLTICRVSVGYQIMCFYCIPY